MKRISTALTVVSSFFLNCLYYLVSYRIVHFLGSPQGPSLSFCFLAAPPFCCWAAGADAASFFAAAVPAAGAAAALPSSFFSPSALLPCSQPVNLATFS